LRLPAAPSLRFSPSSRVLPSYTYPTAATAESSHGLPLPSALEESEVHFTRVCPPATVRLQGLATLLTAYSLESRAGFVSHRQRSWDSPFGEFPSRKVSTAFRPGRTHIPFSLAVIPPPKRRTGPTGLGSWVHASRECLATDGCLSRQPLASPLGFAPLGPARENLGPDFSEPPLTRFANPGDYSPDPPAPQSLDRPSPRPARRTPECTPAEATLLGFLHLPAPDRSSPPAPGLLSSPRVGPHITADSPTLLGHRRNPAEANQDLFFGHLLAYSLRQFV
jgi:hypothetical protein